MSLERITRKKQDGRFPSDLLDKLNWKEIKKCGLSTDSRPHIKTVSESIFLPKVPAYERKSEGTLAIHGSEFGDNIKRIQAEVQFICHQRSHASSAAWASPFEKAIVITYDGGMFNCNSFGGVYEFDREKGISEIEIFGNTIFKRITALYTFITAVVGFSPNKHEGKVTGIAGGLPENLECTKELFSIFDHHYHVLEGSLRWRHSYSNVFSQYLSLNHLVSAELYYLRREFSVEDLCKSVQVLAEKYSRDLVKNVVSKYGKRVNLCVAGGLFSNVSINRIISDETSGEFFVAPFMTDDGTALGVAYELFFEDTRTGPRPIKNVFFGFEYSDVEIERELNRNDLTYYTIEDEVEEIANRLSKGEIVARFSGKSEFGPRALGNRSIFANPYIVGITNQLNSCLDRSDFMPFAPLILKEKIKTVSTERLFESDRYMTRTIICDIGKRNEVIHKDGTARIQLVDEQDTQLRKILIRLDEKYNIDMIINTSFNMHEEPIVESPNDAIKSFLRSGLDCLILNGKYVVENLAIKGKISSGFKFDQSKQQLLDIASDIYEFKQSLRLD